MRWLEALAEEVGLVLELSSAKKSSSRDCNDTFAFKTWKNQQIRQPKGNWSHLRISVTPMIHMQLQPEKTKPLDYQEDNRSHLRIWAILMTSERRKLLQLHYITNSDRQKTKWIHLLRLFSCYGHKFLNFSNIYQVNEGQNRSLVQPTDWERLIKLWKFRTAK